MTLVDTGQATMTGGRLKRVLRFIEEENFLVTYGDGVTDSDINASIAFHQAAEARSSPSPPCSRRGGLAIWRSQETR